MKTLLKFLRLDFIPVSYDFGLLVLRLWFGGSLLLLHGWDKFMKLTKDPGSMGDPIGIGAVPSHVLAVFGEVVCAALVVLGLGTRFGALGCAITMGVAFLKVHNLKLTGSGSGEMAFMYLSGFVVLILMGGGHYGVDSAMVSKAPVKKSKE